MTNTAFNVTSFLAVTLYQGNHDMQHKPRHVKSIWRYKLKCCFFEIENSQWENWNHLFLNVGQELNQSYSIHGIFYFRLNWKEAIDIVTWIFQWEDIIHWNIELVYDSGLFYTLHINRRNPKWKKVKFTEMLYACEDYKKSIFKN